MPIRHFSPYELNQLRRYGFPDIDTSSIGEKPVEYLTGHAEFRGLDLLVNEFTLIPRLESEKIVQIALDYISDQNLTHPTIADIGTGSGCLGISLASELQRQQIPYTIYMSDISTATLEVAQKNASELLHSPANIFFQQSDLLKNYPRIKFDLLLVNLPYIPSENLSGLDSSVKNFEPRMALDGGPRGIGLINELIREIPDYLSEHGIAIIEIDDTQTQQDFTIPDSLNVRIEKDLRDVPRFLIVSRKP